MSVGKKVIITAGGTGGHIFPAVSLGEELQRQNVEVLFAGQGLPEPFQEIKSSPISPKKALQSFRNLQGMGQGVSLLRRFRPDLVVGFGSIYSLPLLAAAVVCRKPVVLHEQNCFPGRVNRLMSRFALTTAVSFDDAAEYLIGNSQPVAMPLREGYRSGTVSREEARRYFGLDPELPTLLLFGGSQGARALNRMLIEALPDLNGIQFLHLSGKNDAPEPIEEAYREAGIAACVKPFEDRMDFAWQAADLLLSRAGAGTIAEQIAFEVPGILVPYPHAMDNHQDKNADFMTSRVGGAVKIPQSALNGKNLAMEIRRLLSPDRLEEKRQAIRQHKNRSRQKTLTELVIEYLEKPE